MNEIERCPKCDAVIALVGRVHNCRPRDAVSVPVTGPKPKPRFGDAVNIPVSEMPARGVENALVHKIKSSRGGVDGHALNTGPNSPDRSPRAVERVAAGAEPGPREAKLRAKKGTATYTGQYRDPDKRRASQRELMRKRRAKEPA